MEVVNILVNVLKGINESDGWIDSSSVELVDVVATVVNDELHNCAIFVFVRDKSENSSGDWC